MNRRSFHKCLLANTAALSLGGSALKAADRSSPPGWTQWGGPTRNFSVKPPADAEHLSGIQFLWERPLGKGHSAIVSDGEVAYSLHLHKDDEVLQQWNIHTGDKQWQSRYAIRFHASIDEFDGPHATPLLIDDRVVVVSMARLPLCFPSMNVPLLENFVVLV